MVNGTFAWFLNGILAVALVGPLPGSRVGPEGGVNWHEDVFFGIHYDLHANANDTDLGKDLTPEHLRERLQRTRPDWVQTDCKGHPGYTSWPTKVGSTSPGVVKDSLRIYRDVTRELGIKLGVHYSGVWDSRAVELHPDWARLDTHGQRDPNQTCRTSSYDEQLMIPQMLEIIAKYDIDGFWVDGENWASRPCWCDRCKAEFTRRTGAREIPTEKGQLNWEEWLAFHRDLFTEHVTKYTTAVHTRKRSCMVVSNWMYTTRQPEAIRAPIDYLSGDFSWSWGADSAALEGRVMSQRGLSWDLMAWGFIKTGAMNQDTPWVFKTPLHLKQEVSEVVALGGAVMIYESPQRNGWLTGWRNEVIAEVGEFCRARRDICFRSQTVPEAAVLHLVENYYANNEPLFNFDDAVKPIQGALQSLLETRHSTDVLTEDAVFRRISEYKLVVIPETTRLSARLTQSLENYARAGGLVVLSGDHLARDYSAMVGASPRGAVLPAGIYLRVGNAAVPVSGPWQVVTPAPGTQALAVRLTERDPQRNSTDQVVVTKRPLGQGAIVAIHGPVFRDYNLGHYPRLRQFLGDLVSELNVSWRVTVEASPRLEVIVRQKDDRLLVNLLNRGADEMLSPHRVVIEELTPIENVIIRIRQDRRPKSVSCAPGNERVEWSFDRGVVTARVPRVEIHQVLVVE
jgi:hypothetical protein